MKETKVQNSESFGVAETGPYTAAEAPGGRKPSGETSAHRVAVFSDRRGAGVSGSGFIGCPEDPDVSGHEIYCGCVDCRPPPLPVDNDACVGCGETCDDEFCFCPSDCAVCDDNLDIDLGLEQFTFTIVPSDLPEGDFQDCWNPDTYMAFWDDGVIIVADTQSDARWRVVEVVTQDRPASRQYYTWYCERIGVADPCTEDFMKAISS